MGDAFYDPAFCRALVQAIGADMEIATATGRLQFKPTRVFKNFTSDIAALTVSRPSTTSSNTVVTLDDTLFLKGYRRLRQGLNPELEMGRFLTEVVRFPNCVPVLGALEYFMSDGNVMTLALVQGYVPNQGDGWDYTSRYVERFLEELRISGEANATAGETHGGFLAFAATLGQRTAELHLALAQHTAEPAFDPEPLLSRDVIAFKDRAAREVTATLSLLHERQSQLPAAAQEGAQALLLQEDRLQTRIAAVKTEGKVSIKTRYHGDYHLGQVLVTGNDFVIIDFEGEPARSFEERRTKSSPLRDVAGMLRSFNYARWSALRRVAQNTAEIDQLEPAVREWERSTREAFLAAYEHAMMSVELAQPVDLDLLALFELEKALYELRYELNNRIDWIQVPLQGILALIDPDTGLTR
jgi:maltose alpha-D-glucosyltransferase/alpha-amylase